KTNISIKIFSLVFAFAMWFIVMNTLNPSETKTYSTELTLLGMEDLEENGLICLNLDELTGQTVKIKVKATRPDLTSLDTNKDKITAVADISRLLENSDLTDLSQDMIVSVVPNLSIYSNAYEIVGYSPSSLSVRLDNLVDFDVPTKVIVQNEPGGSYVHEEPVAAVSTVKVKGPESLMENVSYAGLIIDLSDVTDDNVANIEPVLFDSEGNEISDDRFTIYEEYVQVSTTVMQQSEIRVELSGYDGTAEAGYSVTDVNYSPEIISVLGKNKTSEPLILPSIDISGAEESITRTFDIQSLLEERGLMAASEDYLNVRVEIVIEKEDPSVVKISRSDITTTNLGDGYYVSSILEDVSFELYGNKDVINSAEITAYADLEGLTAGTHRVKVTPVLPAGVSAVEDEYVHIEIAAETIDAANGTAAEEESSEETTSEDESEEETAEPETTDSEEEDE
ncbi:MAG: hypothetical protein LUH47_07170, partial [Clostridiales bacterium]|nr:hypothetical protein [Clostridiales bacterium]